MRSDSGLQVVRRAPSAGTATTGVLAVLVHGSMDRATSFARLTAQLPEWTVVAYDRRGYAGSASLGPARGFGEQVDDLVQVLDGEPAVAFGHSYGGDVVLAAAALHPGLVRSALVWEPPQPWLAWWPDTSPSGGAGAGMEPGEHAEWFMRRMVGDRVWDRLPAATRSQRRGEGVAFQAEMAAFGPGRPFDPTRIVIPVLVGRGGRSRPHQRRAARELASALPRGELVEIAGVDHGAHLSRPGEVAGLLRRAAALAR
ncbi:MAG: alpha/beta fold hydrolase [Acidimicrobiales bacterium]